MIHVCAFGLLHQLLLRRGPLWVKLQVATNSTFHQGVVLEQVQESFEKFLLATQIAANAVDQGWPAVRPPAAVGLPALIISGGRGWWELEFINMWRAA